MAAPKHTIVALVENRPGVLNRVASLFRRRNFNIESIAVGHTDMPDVSRMTIVVDGANTAVEQVTKQLYKLIEAVKVSDITAEEMVARELALIKVKATASTRGEIIQIVDVFRANIIDVSPDSIIIEVTGDEEKINSLLQLLKGFGIKEIARTGRVSLVRGMSGAASLEEESTQSARVGPQRPKAAPGIPGRKKG
ncbi:MAG: acetolactate synthase small subunit [Chloroflexi bacterium]|nr:acetolactate synthase small subunit [Chloroflexota bacterium]